MFLVLAFMLLVVWLIAVGAAHVTAIGIHVLVALAIVCVLFHFVRVRHYRARPDDLPKDAIR
jgi:hypothetical protein